MRLLSLPISLLLALMQARVVAAFATSVPSAGRSAAAAADGGGGGILAAARTAHFSTSRAARARAGFYLGSGSGSGFGGDRRAMPTSPSIFGGLLRGGGGGSCGMGGSPGPQQLRASTEASAAASGAPSSSSSSSSAAADGGSDADVTSEEADDRLQLEIKAAAAGTRHITGPSTRSATFGSVPYLDTTALDASAPKKQHRVLFVLGGPGAGKGTQSERIVSTYKCVHLSVGELLRQERERGDASPHAELIEECLVAGRIVPVEISLNLLKRAMDDAYAQPAEDGCKYGTRIFLVDGFPRNFDNLEGWTANMPEAASCLGALVYDCPQDVLEARILSRAETSGRSDDNLTSARKRFKTFQDQTMPVVMALEEVEKVQDEESDGRSRIRVRHILGTGTVEEVWDETRTVMDGFVANDVLSANARLIEAVNGGDSDLYGKLCDPGMFVGEEEEEEEEEEEGKADGAEGGGLEAIFNEYERESGGGGGEVNEVANASVEIHDGTRAVVSYDRTIRAEGSGEVLSSMRETRVWSHGETGWSCIHFYRTPL